MDEPTTRDAMDPEILAAAKAEMCPPPHIAIIERHDTTEQRAVIVPDGQSLGFDEDAATRRWLDPYLGTEWHLVRFVPVAFIPDAPSSPTSWPAGDPNEAEIRAAIAHDSEPLVVVIDRGDLKKLDQIAVFAERMAEFWSDDFGDDLFNLRNGMVPFKPGEAKSLGLYDPEDD